MYLPEQQVLAAIKEGNEPAFEMLFKTYYAPLCRYAYTFLRDKEESEEVVQKAFLGIWDKRTSLIVQTSIRAYLFRMVRNASLNVIKHDRVRTMHARAERAGGEPAIENASQPLMATELEHMISAAILSLPEQCRIVFQLSRVEELSYAEIATQLNISVKTVENQIGRALKTMRQQLKEYLPLLLIFLTVGLTE